MVVMVDPVAASASGSGGVRLAVIVVRLELHVVIVVVSRSAVHRLTVARRAVAVAIAAAAQADAESQGSRATRPSIPDGSSEPKFKRERKQKRHKISSLVHRQSSQVDTHTETTKQQPK